MRTQRRCAKVLAGAKARMKTATIAKRFKINTCRLFIIPPDIEMSYEERVLTGKLYRIVVSLRLAALL